VHELRAAVRFAGKHVLLTGAAGSIGEATAAEFARGGAELTLTDMRSEAGQDVATRMRSLGAQTRFVPLDVADVAALSLFFAGIHRLHVAVNIAGIVFPPRPFEDIPLDEYDRAMAINARGVFLCMQHEIRCMRRHSAGVILNVASQAAHVGVPGVADYVASKHAVMGMTRVAALELARANIRVAAISPGAVDTPMLRNVYAGRSADLERAIDSIPLGRLIEPSEIARAIAFLASDDGAQFVGHSLLMDGGCVGVG
jgi:NAD(P)-dependent dehydrogenase (short-subunit alcohol dehydrogenase family)